MTDITEVQCSDGKLYIAPIMDCFNGEIIGLAMDDNMRAELCTEALNNAWMSNKIKKAAIVHSDRGSQYTSKKYRDLLMYHSLRQSMSGAGKCYDNARMESFFATLKKEKLYRMPTHRMLREQVKTIVFRYIMVYYNRFRVYTRNPGGVPPVKMRELWERRVA